MQIIDITVFSYDAKYAKGRYTMSGGRVSLGEPSIVVRVRTDDGIEGWAETAPLGSTYLPSSFAGEVAALKELGPAILGLDPRSPGSINAAMDRVMIAGTAAKATLDMACWDIMGKSMQLSTAVLLGGKLGAKLPAFSVIGVGEPEIAVQKARDEVLNGVKALQLKVGDDPLSDARRVRAVREALPDSIEVWADANGGWNLDQALRFARALEQDLAVPIEQPCRLISECVEVGRRTGLPITLDESIFTMADLVAAHAGGITGVNIKISRVGGFTKARTLRDAAVALDMMVVIDDTWGCALTTAQNIQLAASTPPNRLRAVDLFAEWTHPMIAEIPRMQSDGNISCNDLAGNGIGEINMGLLGDPLFRMQV
ncbi:unnamed protein product [Penicillium salamii]|uniref:Mandelate racemase/muconate lactonizing enzyme C-terminal domain-containing protein n=1 Tax=Penicillium salamii TaxID=1612424 RepID=A0A9W4JV05_9EURO|nr:unnamed protein product [Penicillium salamii]CAG8310548.1 unnamed protein product [Penicillium salamii]CAG8328738.1 unnamed protein product [Penicillium salamii]CAG8409279.1 unnamed protein product [Penicillium salamii]CAG8414166.1 unnamed protein product [Penicillium salamii]